MKKNIFRRFIWILIPFLIFCLGSCDMSMEDPVAGMSSREMIELHTRGVSRAVLTVGIVQNGQMSFRVYGQNGRELPNREHIYEIGSITKVFTAQLFAKAISENLVSLDDSIERFLDLPRRGYYPTIRRILSHTSGYELDYFGMVISPHNIVPGVNPFYGLTKRTLLDYIGRINLDNRSYPHLYSNFGYGVAGLVIENIYNEDYTSLMNNYLKNNLGLSNTSISEGKGDLSNYWVWDRGNAYIPTGGLVSTVTDMLKYAQMQITKTPSYVSIIHNIESLIESAPPHHHNPELNFRMDAFGNGWAIDTVNNIIWHGGTTSSFNAYIGVDLGNDIAVVVLTNTGRQSISTWAIGSTILKELR